MSLLFYISISTLSSPNPSSPVTNLPTSHLFTVTAPRLQITCILSCELAREQHYEGYSSPGKVTKRDQMTCFVQGEHLVLFSGVVLEVGGWDWWQAGCGLVRVAWCVWRVLDGSFSIV
ncbi:hypothetical protein E2C01_094734 [Portunus trituberculatus]|uniref:Uncharacterized protein n=1 Tax=Portunus trituberculatus TaxID=210409 RepID=A0A5B7K1N1_PORTR|nr:hypothetical protein [Portunus trituberculatus]